MPCRLTIGSLRRTILNRPSLSENSQLFASTSPKGGISTPLITSGGDAAAATATEEDEEEDEDEDEEEDEEPAPAV